MHNKQINYLLEWYENALITYSSERFNHAMEREDFENNWNNELNKLSSDERNKYMLIREQIESRWK